MKHKYIGISNGEKYPVIKIDVKDKKVGLTKLSCMTMPCWCTFERITPNSCTEDKLRGRITPGQRKEARGIWNELQQKDIVIDWMVFLESYANGITNQK